jgi:hypothetical protein
MRRVVVLLATMMTGLLVGFAALAPAASAGTGTQQDPFGPGDKVDFCHYDGSDTGGGSGKYNMPNASATATGPAGHQEEHEFDVIPSYWFAQHEDEDPVFFPGRNWPTLNHLPTSPIDFSPLLGSSASAFIAGGCGAPPCPSGTTTVTVTSTAPPVTVTETVTETVSAAAAVASQQASSVVPVPEEDCTETVTKTVTPTVTVTKTITNTVSTTTPPAEAPSASLSTPVCTNQNIVATGVNPTDAQITFDVFVNGNLVDSFIVAANSQGTSASIPVKDGDVVTVKVQGKETVLATKTVDLDCVTTTTVTTPPPVTTTPPPVTTTPPPVTTTPPPPVTTTPPPPVTTTPPPPPVGGPGPGNPPNNPPANNPPSTLAFTGPEAALPIGALAVALATAGTGMMWLGRKRRDVTPPRPDLDD